MSEISKTADRALAILIELADAGSSTPQQMAKRMGMNRTVMQRLLTTLLARGFVTRAGGEYALDSRLRNLAAAVQPQLHHAAEQHCTALSAKTGETVVFHVLDDDAAIVLFEAVQVRRVSLQVRHDVGTRSSLTQSASGLAILGALDRAAVRRLLRAEPDAALAEKLAAVRETGYALTSDEFQEGVSGISVAVHRLGEVVGSIAILVPTSRVEDLEEYRKELGRTVERIEASLERSRHV